MLQQSVDGFSVSASTKRPARAVFGFALAVMLASLVPTDNPVFVSSAYAGDVINEGVMESSIKPLTGLPKIVSCKAGWERSAAQGGFGEQTCKKSGTNVNVSLNPLVPVGLGTLMFFILGEGSGTPGTTGTTGTTGTR
jgi:hypothetical protein